MTMSDYKSSPKHVACTFFDTVFLTSHMFKLRPDPHAMIQIHEKKIVNLKRKPLKDLSDNNFSEWLEKVNNCPTIDK